MVSLGKNYLYQIDTLVTKNNDFPSEHKSAIEQMKDSIRDANSKYSALWKLYVFISDGLFYTGIYNKIKDTISGQGSNTASELHKKRLNEAQDFFITAFDTITQDWERTTEGRKENRDIKQFVNDKEVLLGEQMNSEVFKHLIKTWVLNYESIKFRPEYKKTIRSLSTVNIDHYVHSHPLQEEQGRNCRDIRYKMDYKPADIIYCKTKKEGHKLISFLKNIGFNKPDVLTELEFDHLLELFDDRACQTYELLTNNRLVDINDLKLLWLSGFPWPEYEGIKPEKVSRSPRKEELQQTELKLQVIPQTDGEIEDWLLNETEILEDKRVIRQFNKNISSIKDKIKEIVESLPQELRQEVFADLKQRFRNDSRLIFNDIKVKQLIYTLERRWQKSDDN